MPEYFCWNILGLLQNAPITFVIEFKLLYDNMLNLPRATSAKVHMIGLTYVVTAYIIATVQTLPYWLFAIFFRYYFLQEVIGLKTTNALSGLICAIVAAMIIYLIRVKCLKKAEEEEDPSAENQSMIELSDVSNIREIQIAETSSTDNPIQQ